MNLTYIIGNGFDINLNMKTSYKDFYKYYCNEKTNDQSIQRLKDNIGDSIDSVIKDHKRQGDQINWADMEEGFGRYTKYISSYEELKQVYYDLNRSLKEYLKQEENLLFERISDKTIQNIKKDFSRPFDYLRSREQERISGFIGLEAYNIEILNFNYTHTIERILGFEESTIELMHASNGRNAYLNHIYHIHGTLDDPDLILGLNDISQIENVKFRQSIEVEELMVKPSRNDLEEISRNRIFSSVINNTKVFVLFGVSMGVTDNKWWDLLKNELPLSIALIFVKIDKKQEHTTDLSMMERAYKKTIIKRLAISESEAVYNTYEHSIFVCCFYDQVFRLE